MRNILVLIAALALAGCGGEHGGASATSTGFVSEEYMRARSLDYLRYATQTFSPGAPLNLIAHLEREAIDPPYQAPRGAIPSDAFDGAIVKMDTLRDTRDFDALYMLNLLLGYRDHPALPAELMRKTEEALIRFKMWFTEPTPAGKSDDSYYWTENHQLIYHTIELLIGQEYPDRLLSTDQATGREHYQRARARIIRWLEHRARWGFVEWHSNVYYQKDFDPLITLVEFADDEEIRTKAAAILDLLIFDMAMHTQRGAFGSTHGRSYKKDKMTSLDDDTWNGVKLLFDESTYDYESVGAPDAVMLSRSKRYRMPEAILRVAKTKMPFADRERISLPLDEDGPYDPNVQAPFGLTYGEDDLDVWWGMSALTAWPVVPLTLRTFETYNLWESSNFADFAALKSLVSDVTFAQNLAIQTRHLLGFSILKEVNTYTYRTPDYMLSSALDYRKGSFAAQVHSWQATLDANALVFTTHAFRPPLQSTVWSDDTETGSYWTGEASMPRSAQDENVAIHIYTPQYSPTTTFPSPFFHYENYTHAYFPQDHFDEVVQAPANPEGTWTFGRLGDGYVALYSFRPVHWIEYDPNVYATNGMVKPFDLRTEDGANNVWIVECGRAADGQTFEGFKAAIAAAPVQITPKGRLDRFNTSFDVVYDSPSKGRMTFGWDAPLTVDGVEVPQSNFKRYDNPFSQTDYNTLQTSIEAEGFGLELDVGSGTRTAYAP